MASENTATVVVRVSPDVYEQLRSRADNDERSVAQTIRLAIRQFLDPERQLVGG